MTPPARAACAFALSFAAALACVPPPWPVSAPARAQTTAPPTWPELLARIAREFPDVVSIDARTLAGLPRRGRRAPRLLDARTAAEFAVSHLEGAERIDPDAPDLLRLRPSSGRLTVVYCSVGYRSARIARRLAAEGHGPVRNLEGGIFRWVAEGRPVVRDGIRVRDVHPYDAVWGQLLDPAYRTTRPRAARPTP